MVNCYFERFGHEARIDHRSLEAQAIDREPTSHLGPTATDFELEGVKTERGNINREIKERNRQREQLTTEKKEVVRDLAEASAAHQAKTAQEIRSAWTASHNGLDFLMGLNERGLFIAQDDKGRYSVVSANAFVHRLDTKTHGEAARDMSAAIEAVCRECNGLIIPTVDERPEEVRRECDLEKQRDAAHLGTTLCDRTDMVSVQHDAMRHLKDPHRTEQRDGDGLRPKHPDEHRQR
jgi:hypothetical protein